MNSIFTIKTNRKWFNIFISSDNKYLYADTNDSSRWEVLKVKLPESKSDWLIDKVDSNNISLITRDLLNMEEALK